MPPTLWAGRLDDDDDTAEAQPGAGGSEVAVGGPAASRRQGCRGCLPELQVSEQTYYRWRNQFGGLKAEDAKRLKDLERENSTLKRLLADAELEKAALKEIARDSLRSRGTTSEQLLSCALARPGRL